MGRVRKKRVLVLVWFYNLKVYITCFKNLSNFYDVKVNIVVSVYAFLFVFI